MSREKNVRLLIMIFISFYLIKILRCPVCLLLYWFVDHNVPFAQALIMLIRTSLGLFSASIFDFYQIISHGNWATPKFSLHIASSVSNIELWQLFYSAEISNFALFSQGLLWPLLCILDLTSKHGRNLICWRLPPISFKRLLIDNVKGERWTLNRHSNYRL